MKKGAKIISIVLALVLIVAVVSSLVACNKKNTSDWDTVKGKGALICGITYYAPMNYFDGDELVGFDTELANAVGEKLGIKIKFQLISWDDKFIELNSKYIDCIWNGFTVTEDRKENCDFSKTYLKNEQVAVIKTADAGTYTSKDAFSGKKAAVEAGSYGATCAETLTSKDKINTPDSQMAALNEVLAGTSDFAVVDYTLAQSNCGQGSFAALQICTNVSFDIEYYAIGFRKGSDITEKINGALATLYTEGKIATLAQKYGLTNLVVPIA